MKPYTTKHILSTIGVSLIGLPFGFLYGWQYCVLMACAFICYSVAVFFKNPTHPVLWFGYPDWMDTKTVWKNIGCNLLLAIGVAIGCTAIADVSDIFIKVIIPIERSARPHTEPGGVRDATIAAVPYATVKMIFAALLFVR